MGPRPAGNHPGAARRGGRRRPTGGIPTVPPSALRQHPGLRGVRRVLDRRDRVGGPAVPIADGLRGHRRPDGRGPESGSGIRGRPGRPLAPVHGDPPVDALPGVDASGHPGRGGDRDADRLGRAAHQGPATGCVNVRLRHGRLPVHLPATRPNGGEQPKRAVPAGEPRANRPVQPAFLLLRLPGRIGCGVGASSPATQQRHRAVNHRRAGK